MLGSHGHFFDVLNLLDQIWNLQISFLIPKPRVNTAPSEKTGCLAKNEEKIAWILEKDFWGPFEKKNEPWNNFLESICMVFKKFIFWNV